LHQLYVPFFQKHLVGCGVGSKTSVKIVIVDEGVIGTNDSIPFSTSLVDVTTTNAVAAASADVVIVVVVVKGVVACSATQCKSDLSMELTPMNYSAP